MIEIVSPDDDTWNKVPFYANYGPDERPIVDLQRRRVDWLGLGPSGEYRALERSRLIEPEPAELAQRLDWPPPASYTESGTGHALPGPGLVISSPHAVVTPHYPGRHRGFSLHRPSRGHVAGSHDLSWRQVSGAMSDGHTDRGAAEVIDAVKKVRPGRCGSDGFQRRSGGKEERHDGLG